MMIELTPFLKQLLILPGLSAYEAPVRDVITEAWRPLVDELHTSKLGSLHGLKHGTGSVSGQPRRILVSAHMDAIGLIATRVVSGLIHFTGIGGVDARILPGQPVIVYGRQALPGIVVLPADRQLPPSQGEKPVAMEHLLVDTGLPPEEVARLVRPGDLIAFAQPPLELAGETVSGHTLDNRVSVAAVTLCLDELRHTSTAWDVWAVASVQEEVVLGGAFTSPFEIRPDIAIAIDTTWARGPGDSDFRTFPLGEGPVLGWGPVIHPAIFEAMQALAKELEIPTAMEPMPDHSSTDADAMQIVAEGIPTMVMNIPIRYMHTPVELVALKDIRRTAHLLAEFIARLEPDFLEKIGWDE
jgi:putative aminopeptidase FrvX